MMPWNGRTFRKHNKDATAKQLTVGAKAANAVLHETGDEGRAVRAGNAAIRKMKRRRQQKG
jgi:hypothetical protein